MIQNLFPLINPIVSVHETWQADKPEMQWHSHNTMEFVYVRSGSLQIYFESQSEQKKESFYLSKGQFGIIAPHTKHLQVSKSDPTDFYVLELEFMNEPNVWQFLRKKTFLSEFPDAVKLIEKSPDRLSFTDTQDVFNILHQLSAISFDYFNHNQNCYFEIEYTILLQRLLLAICKCGMNRIVPQSNHYIKKCVLLIQDKITEKLSVSYLAKEIGISPSYLQRLFKKKFGKTVLETINDFRLIQAEKTLVTTKMTLGDIAIMSGFPSSGTFYLNFTKKYGISPSAYRKKNSQPTTSFNKAVSSHYFDFTPLLEN